MSGKKSKADDRDKIEIASENAEKIKEVLRKNMEEALSRTERLDDIDQLSLNLDEQSKGFLDESTTLRRRFCCKNALIWGLLLLVIGLVVGLIIWWATK